MTSAIPRLSLAMVTAAAMVLGLLILSAEAAGPRRGEAAPAFSLPDLGGSLHRLPAAAEGKILVLHFWGSTCSFCRDEILALKKLHDEFGAELLPVSINVGEKPSIVSAFATRLQPRYPFLLDAAALVARQYGVVGIPVTYVADRRGVIRFRIFGEINEEGLRRLIEAIRTPSG